MRWSFALGLIALTLACTRSDPSAPTDQSSQALNGVPQNGFPNAVERQVLVLANRARADPTTALASCAADNSCADHACYTVKPPLGWNYNFNRSARFHATNLLRAHTQNSKCGLQHESPCNLVTNISSLYLPNGTCNADISCACQNAALLCPTTTGTPPFTRIAYFGSGATGENAASGYPTAANVMDGWLLEPDSDKTCGFRETNGHRVNLLSDAQSMGVGYDTAWWVQDLGGAVTMGKLVAGAEEDSAFRANWYDPNGGAPSQARVNVDGVCSTMTRERGAAANSTWLATVSGSGCRTYFFDFVDSSGTAQRLPSTGAYQTGCSTDYTTSAPAVCGGSPVDAGQPDAGHPVVDAGQPDAGQPVVDAGQPDAGHPVVDAGQPDAGHPVVDAGQPVADAGLVDGGGDTLPEPADAGVMTDPPLGPPSTTIVDGGSLVPPVGGGPSSNVNGGLGCRAVGGDVRFALLALAVGFLLRRRS